MTNKDNKTSFDDLSKEQQEDFYDACNRYFSAISKATIDDKEWYVSDELTKLNEKGEKLLKIYDILYDLYVDDTDCTQCAWYDDCSAVGKQCAYNEKFFATDQIKQMLFQKANEIYKIATK